ncbi:MAG: hypothetical protein IT558_03190 [Alphaproteobacteria bacterium]|nr:hypothetical protein [Alphaproteobacteria bacterium]
MLADFLLLENYYGSPAAALYFEDLSRHYGIPAIRKALRAGDLVVKRILCGPDCGRLVFRLSEQGRLNAQKISG